MRELVPTLTALERNSLRTMIAALERLPAFVLEADVVGPRSGEVPFTPKIRAPASAGAVQLTTIAFRRVGTAAWVGEHPMIGEADARFTIADPGPYEVRVRRTGVTSTGLTVLEKALSVSAVAHAAAAPTPVIAVEPKGDGTFVISGRGFLPGAKVTIRVADGSVSPGVFLADTATADQAGVLAGFRTPQACQNGGERFFSANDGRSNSADATGTLWSNTVRTSCPS